MSEKQGGILVATNINTYDLLKQGLDVASLRSETISNNIANVNTQGYKSFKVVFEENLSNSGRLEIKTTKEKHMDLNGNNGDIQVVRDETTSMNENGNNVDLDLEKVNQAANTLMYNALITRVNGKLASTKPVIGGN